MEYRQLGRSGLTVSLVGLGCNNFGGSNTSIAGANAAYGQMDLEATRSVVEAALDAGVNFFDTADLYGNGGSERFLGQILKDRRHDVVIATKWGAGMNDRADIAWGSRRYIRQAVEGSLRRLDTDYIDLYQMHWPDPRTPLEETIQALDELVREGKVRYTGHSHFTGWMVADSDWMARGAGCERFVSAQNHYSLLERRAETELIPACARFGVGLLPYFPLENGLLTGKYGRGKPVPAGTRLSGQPIGADVHDKIEALEAFAAERDRTILELAIGGIATEPVVASIITGATKPHQITANAAAAAWRPSPEDSAGLRAILEGGVPVDA